MSSKPRKQQRRKRLPRIYLDHAASTPVDPRVVRAMEPYWSTYYGNAGAMHQEGVRAREALDVSRKQTAALLKAHPDEIIFTGSGTESNSLALFGVIAKYEEEHQYDVSKLRIVTSVIEHPSILEGFRELERRGARVDYIGVDERGIFDLDRLRKVITQETTIVSLMYVNNEVGTIEPIIEAAKIIRRVKRDGDPGHAVTPYFHTDASQAPVYLSVAVTTLGVDLLTIDGQKIYGPKGIGALYIRRGVAIKGLFRGGRQERGLRPGTEPIPLIVGLAKALMIAEKERTAARKRLIAVRNYFIKEVTKHIPKAVLNGDPENRLPNNVNFSFPNLDSDFVIIALDEQGIACASRSACITGPEGSYVVRAMGKESKEARSSIRFSLGKKAVKKDVDRVVRALIEITRTASPYLPR